MGILRTSIKKHKNLYLFLTTIFICGLISGFLFYLNQDASVQKTIIANLKNMFSHNVFDAKNILIHALILLTAIATSFIFLGAPLFVLVIFFEGLSIGFIFPIFFSYYKWGSILNFGLYFILIKLIYVFLLFYFFIMLILFFKKYIYYFKRKNTLFISYLKKLFIICFLVIINDCFVYFISNKILIFLLG